MSAILAIESSTLTASVALRIDGSVVFHKESGVNTHSEVLLALINESLAGANITLSDLSTIAIGAGPGSFTGLRIGMATAKGLCFATGVSLTPVSSLAAMAMDCYQETQSNSLLLSTLDARRGELFVGAFRKSATGVSALSEEHVMTPTALTEFVQPLLENHKGPLLLCGDGAQKYSESIGHLGEIASMSRSTPSAAAVARLAQYLPPTKELSSAAPTYVRLPEAQLKFPDGNTGGTFSQAGKSSPKQS